MGVLVNPYALAPAIANGTVLYEGGATGLNEYIVEAGISLVDIELFAPGGGGEGALVYSDGKTFYIFAGFGAGAGGYCLYEGLTVTPGQTLAATLGAPGAAGLSGGPDHATCKGANAGNATFTFGAVALTAYGGGGGGQANAAGVGGGASGGTTNQPGRDGAAMSTTDGGGAYGYDDQDTAGEDGTAPGGGGAGDDVGGGAGAGAVGLFRVTKRG